MQWLELVYEMPMFFRFAKVLEENLDENEKTRRLGRIDEGHLGFVDFEKVEIIEKIMRARTQLRF